RKQIKIKFLEMKLLDLKNTESEPGKFFISDKKLYVMCGNSSVLEILKLQPEGKKEMEAKAFINGYLKIVNN
ncbi:MAG TPA: methionyl-tRNA formyltransferase, partial [Bacteroidetes bacterium]|nr:methionyl-tRNA formyltransferase [Bacteroidota bacterium]